MRQIDVNLEFDDDGSPTAFVAEYESLHWPFESVLIADWKDNEGQVDAAIALTKRDTTDEIVCLFDGSDSIIYALLGEAVKS